MGRIISWYEVQKRKDQRRQEVARQIEILKNAGIIQEDIVEGEPCYCISESARDVVLSYVNSMR